MTKRSPTGEKVPNDVRSLLSGPGIRILLGLGAGYIARRLWTYPQDSLDSKMAKLWATPTIPIKSLKDHPITHKGELVLIQDGVVTPLISNNSTLYNKIWHRAAVYLKTLEYTVHPKELEDFFKGTRSENVSRVPFAIAPRRGQVNIMVNVKNVDEDHLPLTFQKQEWLNPPVTLTETVTRIEKETTKSLSHVATIERVIPATTKVIEERSLRCGERLENVFGTLRARNGVVEIEPSRVFPKKCFTMSRLEIEKEVRAQARAADVYPIRTCSVGVGLVSLGLLLSGFYSYNSS